MLKPLLTQEDVSIFLHCSESTVRRLVDRKALGCHFINRARRFTQAHLDEYLKNVASRPPKKRSSPPPMPELSVVWERLVLIVRQKRPLISVFLEEGCLREVNEKTRTATLTFLEERRRVSEIFRQECTRSFLEGCLREILGRSMKVEVVAVESLTPTLIPPLVRGD